MIDIDILPFDLHFTGGVDLKVGRPYPNKRYVVVCGNKWRKCMDGILIETRQRVDEFSYTARWAVEAVVSVTHNVQYKILDEDFEAVSDRMVLWSAHGGELGGWPDRRPAWWTKNIAPVYAEPLMEIIPNRCRRPATKDVIDIGSGWIVGRRQVFSMPTIEPGRLTSNLTERLPSAEMAFRLG